MPEFARKKPAPSIPAAESNGKPTGQSLLLQKYGDRFLRAADTGSPAPTITETRGPTADDLLGRMRQSARLLYFLEHDTPERAALLSAAGVSPADVPPNYLGSIAEAILCCTDSRQAEETVRVAWDHLEWRDMPKAEDEGEPPEPRVGLNTRRLSQVIPRDVDWLWPQRVPLGKLTLISGDPDLGKTWVALDLVSRVTTGRAFPDAGNPTADRSSWPRRDVLWVSGEDEDEDTIRPRVGMLGGDPSRVHSLVGVTHREPERRGKRYEETRQSLDLKRHLDHLDDWLAAHPLVNTVVFDPFAAFLGGVDSHKYADVRALLGPLNRVANLRRVAIVGINHLAKGDSSNAMYRSMGSIAFVAAARSSWLVSRDPDEPGDRRLFTCVKNNLASEPSGGLAFRIGPAWRGISWEKGLVATTANEALRVDAPRPSASGQATAWLRKLLGNGPVPAETVLEKIAEDGLCVKTVRSAFRDLGGHHRKTGGKGSPWVWDLPPG